MAVHSEDPRFQELLRALGMPDGCTEFVLTVKVGHVATVDITKFASPDLDVKLKQRYTLVPIDEPDCAFVSVACGC
jgi:hypothetical protein